MHRSGYILCTSPRSGSTLLAMMLTATGVAGHVTTPFHDHSLAQWLRAFGVAPIPSQPEDEIRALFAAIRTYSTDQGGMFGLRIQEHSLHHLCAVLKEALPTHDTTMDRLQDLLGPIRVIHLRREDKLAQAVSFVRASQTGLWHRNPDGSELERLSVGEHVLFDRTALRNSISRFEAADEAWQNWFGTNGVHPFSVLYEDLNAEPLGTLAAVLEDLGLDPKIAKSIKLPTRKLADATSASWIRQYREDGQFSA